jgi:predicted ATP-grasp superfamily ATP-dependent carboligase
MYRHPALVLGMYETGLGVARSLGQTGIAVDGMDVRRDVGFYSRYVRARICPHPLKDEPAFIEGLIDYARLKPEKPVLFITSDTYLLCCSKHRQQLLQYFLFNLPENNLLESIADKFKQFQLAKAHDIPVPQTMQPQTADDVHSMSQLLRWPVLIKGLDVNVWRSAVSATKKGLLIQSAEDFKEQMDRLLEKKVPVIVQEIIPGPDNLHFKYCTYINQHHRSLCSFTLQKIRQFPVNFGVGSAVESIANNELTTVGYSLFERLAYQGVGSAEFKWDERDEQFKLIEINPRYWQQNALAARCQVNFPLINYLDLLNLPLEKSNYCQLNHIKWVNLYLDFQSFVEYRRQKKLTLRSWLHSLQGKKIYSDWSWHDPGPGLFAIQFGWIFIKGMYKFIKKIFGRRGQ